MSTTQSLRAGLTYLHCQCLLQEIGTGGLRTAQSIKENNYWVSNYNVKVELQDETFSRSPKENLIFIREILFLNIVDLADIFNVTRPTIYSWLGDGEPKSVIANYLQFIAEAVKEIQDIKIANMGKLIHRPIFNGQSLLDKIKSRHNFNEAWQEFKKVIQKELKNRSTLKGSGKNKRDVREAVDDYSMVIDQDSNKSNCNDRENINNYSNIIEQCR